MTPISALSFLPVAGPPPSGQAGIGGASPATSLEVIPGAMPDGSGEVSALNWLMAWLGEHDIETDSPETVPQEAPPSPAPSKVHWMSLVPAAVSIEEPAAADEVRTGEEQPLSPVSQESPEPETPVVAALADGSSKQKEDEDPVALPTADPLPTAPSAPLPVAPVVASIPLPVPAPVDTGLPAITAATAPAMKAVRSDSPIADAAPEQPGPAPLPAVNGMTRRPAPRAEDKGEIVWSAKFVVNEERAVEPAIANPVPTARPQPESPARPVSAAKPEPPAKPPVPAVRTAPIEDSPRQQLDPENSESGGEEPEKRHALDFPRERLSRKVPQDPRQDSASSGGEYSEPKSPDTGVRASAFTTEFVSRAAVSSPAHDAAPVEGVSLEPVAPLKPAQIATLQVDVPAPVGSEDMTPMRLVVSQRGDQVNVRLRSFDSTVAPIDDSRMQPLLHSLAEKGFVAELKPGSRLDESIPMTVERTQEKQTVMTESSGSQNDPQSFQNTNERQQQNQERQQQQQAFFLRKQLKNVQSEAFTLPVATEPNKGSLQQGVSR